VVKKEEESNSERIKPQSVGSTPSYGFAFKCNERAEKRREVSSRHISFAFVHFRSIIPWLTHPAIK
jgi:hypothetical protein